MKAPIRFEKVGKKKIQVWHNNFEYYQPNDHECGDCGIRAVSKALGNISWEEALTELYNTAIKIKEALALVTILQKLYGVTGGVGFRLIR